MKKINLILAAVVSTCLGCSALDYNKIEDVVYKNFKQMVLIGDQETALGAIIGDKEVVTIYNQDGIEKNDEFERVLYTLSEGALSGFVRFPRVYIDTEWVPEITNKDLNIALIKTKDDLEYKPIQISDAKLGNCIVLSLQYYTYEGQIAAFIPYGRKAGITCLPEEDIWKLYQNGTEVDIKKGQGELTLEKSKERRLLCFITISSGAEGTFHEWDYGSLIIQDDKLVGIITSRNAKDPSIGYFTRGSELEKLLEEYKTKK